MVDTLQQIQSLQFKDKGYAEALLLSFIRQNFPFDVESVSLRPSAISLNSFNGILTLKDGQRLFFKSHTESDTIINEYYNTELLASAGYPIIQPIFRSTEVGKQFLAYELIESRSVFDIAWEIENYPRPDTHPLFIAMKEAQIDADKTLFEIYKRTFRSSNPLAAQSPIHQLFYHRLAGGRLKRFYGSEASKKVLTLNDVNLSLSDIWRAKWVINGRIYKESLADIVEKATELLKPSEEIPSIIGHGDAHNGNIFLIVENNKHRMRYFDPAFAGQHHPLLDLAKPLFHNVFAMWMYYPHQIAAKLAFDLSYSHNTIYLQHNYKEHPIRTMFWHSKVENTLIPTLLLLKDRGLLDNNWRQFLKHALLCCPLLTMNLMDETRFPSSISLLGFSMTIEMGASGLGFIDSALEEISQRL